MRPLRLLPLLPFAILLLLCLNQPSRAGQWVATYETQGSNTGENDAGDYLVDEAWPNLSTQAPSQFLFLDMTYPAWGEDEDNIHSEGSVTAIWTAPLK